MIGRGGLSEEGVKISTTWNVIGKQPSRIGNGIERHEPGQVIAHANRFIRGGLCALSCPDAVSFRLLDETWEERA